MKRQETGFNLDVPNGWTEAIIRSVIVAITGFLVLQVKEYIDAGIFDTIGTATDSLLIAGAYLFVNAGLIAFTKPTSGQHKANQPPEPDPSSRFSK